MPGGSDTALIVCPGPSLAWWSLIDADLCIAVNRAARACEADWWVFADWQTYIDNHHYAAAKRARIFTSRSSRESLTRRGYLGGACVMTYEEVPQPHYSDPANGGWAAFSMVAAVVLAYHLGAVSIQIVGADMRGQADWDGYTHERFDRSQDAFDRTLELYNGLCGWLSERGVSVQRVTRQAI